VLAVLLLYEHSFNADLKAMDKIQAKELIHKYNEGSALKEEANLLENWYVHESELQRANPEEQDYLKVNMEMWLNIQTAKNQKQSLVLWPRIAAAAAVLLCIGIAFYFYQQPRGKLAEQETAKDFAPGKNSATLTLADGKRILLTDAANGTIASQAGVAVKKTADGKLVYIADGKMSAANPVINTLTTAKSEQYQMVLPDGSKVWLNAASSLKFPASFTGQPNRKVELRGEAYFEVAKDKTRPFIVSTTGQTVEVLGTHFDISSYPDEEAIKTTLLEGSVKVVAVDGNKPTGAESILKPNQQSIVDRNSKALRTARVDAKAVVAWKNGLFQFDDADIKTVMRQLSRWYDIEIEFSGAIPKETFSGKVYRNMSLSKVLDVLSFSQINFKIQARRMTIHPSENK
jgi:transmembrane sensor